MALLCAIIALLFLTGAPSGGAFSWPDSPRHALNGAFVLDLIRAAPIDHPASFAYDYYTRYPALTIGLYPPLFSFQLALFYALFGVSQTSALIALFTSYCFMACGAYALLRLNCSALIAFSAALFFAVLPEIAFWGRQVMLEIPAYAFVTWSAYWLVRHLRTHRIGFLYLSIALLVLGMYTKLSLAFLALPYLIALLHARGWQLARDRHSYVIALLAFVGVVPLLILTLKFGQANIQSAAGISDAEVSRGSIAGWIWYAEQLPSQMGWVGFGAALAVVGALIAIPRWRPLLLTDHLLWLSWLVLGYLFFSAIDLKEARHSIFLLLPLVMMLALVCREISRRRRWLGEAVSASVAVATLATTALTRPVHYVSGYDDAVRFVAVHAPRNSNIIFSGYHDGAFIFEMRAIGQRPDISTIRSDKLLLRIAVRRTLGVQQKPYTEQQIGDMISRLRVSYVVAQPDFWTDLEAMKRFQAVLNGPQFRPVRRFPMNANYAGQERELVVYQNLGRLPPGPVSIENELPIIDSKVAGTASAD